MSQPPFTLLLVKTFWDSFDAAINQNTALSGVQKFSYLRAQLQGDAARTIAGLPLTEANYFHSVALLLERYGKTHKLKDAHMRGLLNIPSPTTKLSSLREFYDMVESHIRSLASLGQTSDSYGTLLVSIILQKLPSDIIRNLARENTSMEWSLDALRQAVLKEITIMEATPQLDYTSTESLNVTASFHTSTGKKSPTEQPVFCVYCKGAHKPAKCESVTDQQKRYDIIKNEGRCFNCLGRHKVSNCTSKFQCRQCKQKHHTTLCKPKENTDEKDAAKSTVHATLSSSQSKTIASPTCLLKTAIAPLQANDILFDEGSQRSFISREMATKLRLQPATSETLSVASFGTRSTLNQTLDVTVVNVVTASGETLRTYDDILSDQEKRGFIEKVPNASPVKGSHYLPHRPIKKESSTTPIRIVYDCSCSGSKKQPSLNDCLMVGPPFLNDLCSILLRFRSYTFALSADIEKAFLHVKLNEVDKDYTRFLWLSDANNPGSALTTYRFKVVPFGTASSPFMLYAAIDLHLSKFKSPVAKDVKRSLYVDNVLSGRDSEKEIIEYYQQARTILKQANFNLCSWSSNSQQLQLRTSEDRTNDSNSTVNVLGLRWNTLTDTLLFASKLIAPRNPLLVTKREVLQASSLIYDPLGFLTPVTVQAKILLQEIWQRHLDWDEPLDKDLSNKWCAIAIEIQNASKVTIPRTYHPSPGTKPYQHLYIFCDASQKAYGAVAYLQIDEQICWMMSRSRVAPVKVTTLPKLELMAAVVQHDLQTSSLSLFIPPFLYISGLIAKSCCTGSTRKIHPSSSLLTACKRSQLSTLRLLGPTYLHLTTRQTYSPGE